MPSSSLLPLGSCALHFDSPPVVHTCIAAIPPLACPRFLLLAHASSCLPMRQFSWSCHHLTFHDSLCFTTMRRSENKWVTRHTKGDKAETRPPTEEKSRIWENMMMS